MWKKKRFFSFSFSSFLLFSCFRFLFDSKIIQHWIGFWFLILWKGFKGKKKKNFFSKNQNNFFQKGRYKERKNSTLTYPINSTS